MLVGHGGDPLPQHRDGLFQQDLLHLLVILPQEHARLQRLRGIGTLTWPRGVRKTSDWLKLREEEKITDWLIGGESDWNRMNIFLRERLERERKKVLFCWLRKKIINWFEKKIDWLIDLERGKMWDWLIVIIKWVIEWVGTYKLLINWLWDKCFDWLRGKEIVPVCSCRERLSSGIQWQRRKRQSFKNTRSAAGTYYNSYYCIVMITDVILSFCFKKFVGP